MEENIKKGNCGHCGNDTFKIYKKKGENNRLIFECKQCSNTTELNITQPEFSIDWHTDNNGKESDGILSFSF